jgi:hypothetical protein
MNHFWSNPVFWIAVTNAIVLSFYIGYSNHKFKMFKRAIEYHLLGEKNPIIKTLIKESSNQIVFQKRLQSYIQSVEKDVNKTKLKVKNVEDRIAYIFYKKSIQEKQNPENETTDK